jgi:hypothetical protein
MRNSIEYTYHASALGVGGSYVHFGREVVVPSVASVVLAPTGGEGSVQVYEYNNQEGVEVASAYSAVKGAENYGVFTTESKIDIIGLSLFGRISIGHMVARVESTRDTNHLPDGPDEATFDVTLLYENVVVDGRTIEPFVDRAACTASYATHHSAMVAAALSTEAAPPVERGDSLRRSVVTELKGEAVAPGDQPYVLNVPGLGRLYFGELVVKRGKRRVNLLRFALGEDCSPTDTLQLQRISNVVSTDDSSRDAGLTTLNAFTANSGMLAIGSGDGNGEPVWPRN